MKKEIMKYKINYKIKNIERKNKEIFGKKNKSIKQTID